MAIIFTGEKKGSAGRQLTHVMHHGSGWTKITPQASAPWYCTSIPHPHEGLFTGRTLEFSVVILCQNIS